MSKNYPENMNWWQNQSSPASKKNEIILNSNHEDNIPSSAKITNTLVIDSRDRNIALHPNPNNYVIDLEKVYKDILSVEVNMIILPHSGYNVTSNNNKMEIKLLGTTYNVTIDPGFYNDKQLFETLQSEIRTATSESTFTLTLANSHSNRLVISCAHQFEMNFAGNMETTPNGNLRPTYQDGSIGRTLGFKPQRYTGASSYTAETAYNMFGERYIVLNIPEFERIDSINDTTDRSFAIVYFDSDHTEMPVLKNDNTIEIPSNQHTKNTSKVLKSGDFGVSRAIKVFRPTKSALGRISIQWKTYDGQFYDFAGQEHMISFEITTLRQHSDYYK